MMALFQAVVLAGPGIRSRSLAIPTRAVILLRQSKSLLCWPRTEAIITAALEAVADALDAPAQAGEFLWLALPPRPTGKLTTETLALAVAALAEGAIIMEEGISSTRNYFQISANAPFHSYLAQPGGAIGLGMPCSTGAAIACPERPVITLQSDGAGMYTLQALWTQAREGLICDHADLQQSPISNSGY